MRRRLFYIASAISFLLFIAAVVTSLMGYRDWRYKHILYETSASVYMITSYGGHLRIFYTRDAMDDAVSSSHDCLGVGGNTIVTGPMEHAQPHPGRRRDLHATTMLHAHLGWITLLFSVLPIAAARSIYVGSALAPDRIADACRVCAYSLTGNTSGVCPECGTSVQQALHAGTQNAPR